jgi:hypothetical protein
MSNEDTKVSIADERRKISPREAREAAAEAGGFLASITITAGGEDYEVPQRGLLDDDQREAMDQLEFESQSWDREDDVEITRDDGSTYTVTGNLKLPYQKGGQLVKPSYAVRVAIALWGQEKYDKYKAAGGQASDVTATLARLDRVVVKRETGDGDTPPDPKSVGGDN